jgi:hypothetical protein
MNLLVIPNQWFTFDAIGAVTILPPLGEPGSAGPITDVIAEAACRGSPPLKNRVPEFWED